MEHRLALITSLDFYHMFNVKYRGSSLAAEDTFAW